MIYYKGRKAIRSLPCANNNFRTEPRAIYGLAQISEPEDDQSERETERGRRAGGKLSCPRAGPLKEGHDEREKEKERGQYRAKEAGGEGGKETGALVIGLSKRAPCDSRRNSG